MSDDSPPFDDSSAGGIAPQPNGTISSGGTSSNGGPTPNPRSCVTCRRRKVRCDKKNPCSNCVRAKTDCVFPGPGRAPRKNRKPPDAELLERLRRLEGVVSSLNAQVEEHEQEAAERERQTSIGDNACQYSNGRTKSNGGQSPSVSVDHSVEGLENRFGRLVVEKGRSRYINNSFWASLNNEVEDLKAILDEPSDDEDAARSPESASYEAQHQGFILGYSSVSVDMHPLRPSEQQARQFWAIYKENVDPLIKVLHVPTFEPLFFDAIAHDRISKPLEPLFFAIYYGAVTSTGAEECLQMWGEDRNTLLDRYRFGLEQGLARANFLGCDEVVILQAFVVFLILLRRNDAARKIWTMTGLVVRIAQTLGVHRDGSHFNLTPFEIEMRRRIWWQVCILDARASEDHGCDPTIVEAQFDTKMPLNVNDNDIHPGMTVLPEERKGFTDMTFCRLRFEVANIFRRILYIPPGPNTCTEYFSSLTVADKEKWITECHQRIEETYLKDCDMSIPLCWVTATVSRLIMSKMWLIVYHPHQRRDGGATLPQDTKDRLFITSLENLEYSILLETEARTMKWGWLFRTYVQWHAIAFLLSELCVRTKGEAVDRAWRALEATASRWWFPLNNTPASRKSQPGLLWKPLRKLLAKARAAREKELALQRASAAIRSGEHMYPGIPRGIEDMKLPPLSVDQPSPENLDRLLRPSAPRLGETPSTSTHPSWPSSPSKGQQPVPTPREPFSVSRQTLDASNGSFIGPQGSTAQDLPGLINFGLDSVVMDVMEGMNVNGSATSDHGMQGHGMQGLNVEIPPQQFMGTRASSETVNGMAQGMQAAHGTFGDSALSSINFANMSPTMGQSSESPIMDGTGIDWTIWDDMVTQFGMEGQPPNPNATNPASHIGLNNWF